MESVEMGPVLDKEIVVSLPDMKVLFIDESGIPELSSLQDHFCILNGVLMEERDQQNFQFLIDRIKEKYKLPLNKNMHAVEMFETGLEGLNPKYYLGKTKRRPKDDRRNSFQTDIWNIIKDYKLEYTSVCVDKKMVRKLLFRGIRRVGDKGKGWLNTKDYYAKFDCQLPFDIGVNALYHWAIRKLKQEEKLKIVFEGRSGDAITIRNHNIISDRNTFKDKHMVAFAKNLKKHVVSVTFANKDIASAGLELSDIIAYTCNKYCMVIRKSGDIDSDLKKAITIRALHKTLNQNRFRELTERTAKKYITGAKSRTRRITNYYLRIQNASIGPSPSPANAGAR